MKTVFFIFLLITVYSCQTETKKATSKTNQTKEVKNSEVDEFEEDKTSKIVADNPNGEYLELYANGKIKIEGQKKDGLREGVWYSYFETGNKWSETTYKKGLKEGVSIVNYPNGKMHYKGQYKNDKKIGTWYFYNEDGTLDLEENY